MMLKHKGKPLSIDRGHQLLGCLRSYPTPRICSDLVAQYVFERPVIVEGPKAESLAQDLHEDWKKLKRDLFDHAVAFGFVAVRAVANQTPTVVPWGLYQPFVIVDSNFELKIVAYPAREQDGPMDKPLRNVVVLDMFGYSPSPSGEFNSLMVPVTLRIRTIVQELSSALYADDVRARPPVYTETKDNAMQPADEVSYDYYADASSLERTSRNTYMRNTDSMAELKMHQNLFKDYFVGDSAASQKCSEGLDCVTPLPIGQKICRAPDSAAPEQLVERMRYLEQECFSLLGVPRSFVMHDITVRHDAGMLHCSFTRTVHAWQEGLAQALTYLVNVTHGQRVPAKRKRSKPPQPPFAVRFEQLPRVGIQDLNTAYDRGVITWEAYTRSMSSFCGMAGSDTCKTKDPWTRDERLMAWSRQAGSARDTNSSPGDKDSQ